MSALQHEVPVLLHMITFIRKVQLYTVHPITLITVKGLWINKVLLLVILILVWLFVYMQWSIQSTDHLLYRGLSVTKCLQEVISVLTWFCWTTEYKYTAHDYTNLQQIKKTYVTTETYCSKHVLPLCYLNIAMFASNLLFPSLAYWMVT